ncbi:MAG: zinc ribbon domain-containing protein [Chthoniobacteraceae bacterium]|jgi:hypothetical protein
MPPPAPTLTCKQCNFANEPERVYCHNCGAKLDRSLLPREPAKAVKEAQEKSARRVRKMVTPSRGFFTNWHKALLNVLSSAVTVAALIQMARPPAGVPKIPTSDDLLAAPQLIEQIEDAQMSPKPQAWQLSESTINLYLASSIKTKGDSSQDYFKFDRAFVNLGKDVIKITAQESAFGYPVYAGTAYKLTIAGGRLVATNVGGSVGRMPVHPMIMEYCGFAFQQLWDALSRERELLDKMQSVSVQPGVFTFVTAPHP